MFKKIIILTKDNLELEGEIIRRIQDIFNESEFRHIKFKDIKKEDFKDTDFVITFGGDGTFVKAGNLIENSVILGVNARPESSEGALTSLSIADIEKIKEIVLGNYEILNLSRARVKLNGEILNEHAINEVYLGAFSQFHSSRYKIKFKDKEEEQRSSGIIISTGTGSPAWFYSAGGEVFNHEAEKLAFIVREPYHGKRLFKPSILNGEIQKGEKIIITGKRDVGGVIAINDSTYDFNEGDIAEIELSDKPLKVIKFKNN